MYLSIGDGLSLGLGPSGNKAYNYNDYIKKYLTSQNKKVSYYNYSKEDISISELIYELIYSKNRNLKEFLHKANLIILSIGENEIKENKSENEIEENIQNLIKEIKKYNSNICLLGHYYLNNGSNIRIKKINEIYKNVAKDNNIIFVNIENIPYYLNNKDKIYPSENGYKEIGKMIIRAINLKNK